MTNYLNPILKPQLSREELQTLSLFNHEGRFVTIESVTEALKAIEDLTKASTLGFDTETKPSFRKGEFHKVALIQLATYDCCYLFRLNKIPFLPELRNILEDKNIKKVGVAIRDDLIALQKRGEFVPEGFIDLAEITRTSKSESLGLRSLCGMYLNLRLSKGAKVTNWESPVLTPAQARYAANDAFVSLLIFEKMFALKA